MWLCYPTDKSPTAQSGRKSFQAKVGGKVALRNLEFGELITIQPPGGCATKKNGSFFGSGQPALHTVGITQGECVAANICSGVETTERLPMG